MGPNRLLDASPAKLRDGSWGARVLTPEVTSGDHLRMMSRNGKVWEATVDRVLKRFDDSALVRIKRIVETDEGCYQCRRSSLRTTRVEGTCTSCGRPYRYE